MRNAFLFTFCLTVAFFTGVSYAADTGGVAGVVQDAKGRPISNATVYVGKKSDLTDVKGQYRIKGLAAGKYKVSVKKGKTLLEQPVEIKDTVIKKDLIVKKK